MDQIVKAIVDFTNWLWGPPLMIILAGGGLFLTIRLGFFQFRHLFYMWGQTFGQMMKKPEDPNAISPFQAATAGHRIHHRRGKHRRCSGSHCIWRPGCRVLDVDHCPVGLCLQVL